MNRQTRKNRRSGFTIIEIMISIAILSVAILGTVASIAFGLRAAKVGGQDSIALSVNRKVMELLLQNQYTPSKDTGLFAHDAPKSDSDWVVARHTNNWQPLYYTTNNGAPVGWFSLSDYGYKAGDAETGKFLVDTAGIELNVSCKDPEPSAPTMDVDSRFVKITVSTRWQDKGRWRHLQTFSFSV